MTDINYFYLQPRLLYRDNHSHKGSYGHLLIVAGCETMPGAAVLATGAALKSGCGLVTLHSTSRALQAVVNNYPSAMLSEDSGKVFTEVPNNLQKYSAIAVGPGLGKAQETKEALIGLLAIAKQYGIRTVIDADALNLLALLPGWERLIPKGSVLTPHVGEYRRLFNETPSEKTQLIAQSLDSVIVAKGYETHVYTPEDILVNLTGGPGLAKGGSGDVLTGLIGGLLARGYSPEDAAALGVWIHGHAGDVLTANNTAEAFNSADLINELSCGFYQLYNQ